MRGKMEDALQSAYIIVLTCGGWTSWATESCVTVTSHFIDNKWEMHSYVLQTSVMHNGANHCSETCTHL